MAINRRQFAVCMGAAMLPVISASSLAQPGKALRLIVGFAAGGAADTVARALGEGLREVGYTAIVENKPGASGRLATEALLSAPADGTTLLLTPGGNLTLFPHVFKGLRYTLDQVAGVGSVCAMGFALAVSADSPAKTLKEFLELARTDPKAAAYGTPGAGTAMHFIGVLLGKSAQVELTHVGYKGGSAAVTDAIGGILPAVITTLPNLLPMHRAGKLRILAISDAEPNPALPGVPTFKSLGFADLTVQESFSVFARAGTPAPVIAQLSAAVQSAVSSPKVAALLQQAQYVPRPMPADALDRAVRAEHASWGRVVQTIGYTPQD